MSTYFAVLCLATRLCPTLCNPIDCSCQAPLSMGILQATTLEWVAISFSRGSSPPRNQTGVSCMVGRFLPAELPGESLYPLQWAKAVHKISQYWLCLINKALLLMTSTLIPENMGLQLSLNTFLKDIYIIYIHTSVRKRKIPREEQWPNFCFCLLAFWGAQILNIEVCIEARSCRDNNILSLSNKWASLCQISMK